jgi:hypothetical protein
VPARGTPAGSTGEEPAGLIARWLKKPQYLIIDGGAGLDGALATQRCTVHKHRNLLAHAPEKLHDEITADNADMICADSASEIEKRRHALLRKRRLKCWAVADSLEEAGDRLFSFTRLPPSQWKSARITNTIERLHKEFKRRIKTQTVLPSDETAAMLFWAVVASGQITMRKVDGCKHSARSRRSRQRLTSLPDPINIFRLEASPKQIQHKSRRHPCSRSMAPMLCDACAHVHPGGCSVRHTDNMNHFIRGKGAYGVLGLHWTSAEPNSSSAAAPRQPRA